MSSIAGQRPQRSEQAVVAMDFFSRSMLAPGFMDDGKWRIIDPSQGQRRWKWYVPDNGKIVVRRNPIAGVAFNIVCRECRLLREVARALCLKRGRADVFRLFNHFKRHTLAALFASVRSASHGYLEKSELTWSSGPLPHLVETP